MLGEDFHGFGHAVYENGNPRVENLLAALSSAEADPRLTRDVPRLVQEATGLFPTIDYALAVMTRMFGLPIGHEAAIFAIARTAGWIAMPWNSSSSALVPATLVHLPEGARSRIRSENVWQIQRRQRAENAGATGQWEPLLSCFRPRNPPFSSRSHFFHRRQALVRVPELSRR
tara:strand:+ start:407 stop:925 length:519 start_codon:yes stop_codon:yes gene_type:complete